MRLSAIDALQHGLLNVRANWQLILIQVLQSFLVLAISAVGLIPIFMVLGFAFVRGVFSRLGSGGEGELLERVLEAGLPLILAVLVTTLIWTVAFVVYCYVQGGILGVLAESERKALTQGIRWVNFRGFSSRAFFAHAERLTWPVFWLLNFFLVFATILLLVFLVGFGLLAVFVFGDGLSAGAGFEDLGQLGAGIVLLGCFGILLLMIVSIFFSAWMQVALAELAVGTRGVLSSIRAGLGTLGRRLPGLALLFLLLIVASIAIAIMTAPLSLLFEMVFRDRMAMYLVGQVFLTFLQWAVTGIVTIGWSGTVIALVVGEREGRA